MEKPIIVFAGEKARMNLKTVKACLKLTLQNIADATDVTNATVSRYTSGIMEIPVSWAEKFCSAFHVDKDWFISGDGDPIFKEKPQIKQKDGAGMRLKQIRNELGLNQKTVYSILGINSSNYSKIENDHTTLTMENARKIEDAFGYGADWLLYGDEEKKEYPVCRRMIEYLWQHKEEREQLWEKMKE